MGANCFTVFVSCPAARPELWL